MSNTHQKNALVTTTTKRTPSNTKSPLTISPAEYLYLINRVHAGPMKLILLVLQELCLKEVVSIRQKWTQIHARDKRKKLRLHFETGTQFKDYNAQGKAEQFLLDLFHEVPKFRFYQFRNYIIHHFGKDNYDHFKHYYVAQDISKKKLTRFSYFRTDEALRYVIPLESRLKFIDENISLLMTNELPKLLNELQYLGSHILNLEEETLQKILTLNIPNKALLTVACIIMDAGAFAKEFTGKGVGYGGYVGPYGAGLGNSSGGSGGFSGGGFGGGGFGGGGAGGSW